MKLEPDIVRDVLLFLEENLIYEDFDTENPHTHNTFSAAKIANKLHEEKGHLTADVSYVIEQLYKAGYITLSQPPHKDNMGNLTILHISDISWNGHQFLNDVRSDTIWETVKSVASKFGSLSIRGLGMAAGAVVRELATNPNFIQNIMEKIIN